MWTDLLAYIWPALPMFFFAGCCFVLAGAIWLFAIRRHEGAVPRKLAAPPARLDSDTRIFRAVGGPGGPPLLPDERNHECVMPRIPGATRPAVQQQQAGPVCPFCGGPFHPVCPSAPKERTEETAVPPALAAQFAALARFLDTIDASTEELAVTADVSAELASDGNHTAAAEVDEAILRRVVDGLREPDPEPEPEDDCPLTTQEFPVGVDASTPFYDAAIRNTDTRELSEVMKKVKQA